jgi:hypothetical protein
VLEGSLVSEELRFPGIYKGIVQDNNDPDHMLRVRVKIPAVMADAWSGWAMPCVAAGTNTAPAIGSQVWVMFEAGDVNYPVWMGQWLTPNQTYVEPPAPPGPPPTQTMAISGNAQWSWSAAGSPTFSTTTPGFHLHRSTNYTMVGQDFVSYNVSDLNNFGSYVAAGSGTGWTVPVTGFYLVSFALVATLGLQPLDNIIATVKYSAVGGALTSSSNDGPPGNEQHAGPFTTWGATDVVYITAQTTIGVYAFFAAGGTSNTLYGDLRDQYFSAMLLARN